MTDENPQVAKTDEENDRKAYAILLEAWGKAQEQGLSQQDVENGLIDMLAQLACANRNLAPNVITLMHVNLEMALRREIAKLSNFVHLTAGGPRVDENPEAERLSRIAGEMADKEFTELTQQERDLAWLLGVAATRTDRKQASGPLVGSDEPPVRDDAEERRHAKEGGDGGES